MKQLGEAAIELARSCRSESVQHIQGTNRAVYHEVYQRTCCPRRVIDFSLKFTARGTVSELLRQKQSKTWGRGWRQMEAGGGCSIREQLVWSWYLILILLSLTASLMVWEWAGVCCWMKCSKARSEEQLKWPALFSDLVQMKRLSANGKAFSNDVRPFQYVGGVWEIRGLIEIAFIPRCHLKSSVSRVYVCVVQYY